MGRLMEMEMDTETRKAAENAKQAQKKEVLELRFVLDEVHCDAVNEAAKLHGLEGCYMKYARNLSTGALILTLYDRNGNIVGRLDVIKNRIAGASAYRDDLRELLEGYVGMPVASMRSNRDDMLNGRPCREPELG